MPSAPHRSVTAAPRSHQTAQLLTAIILPLAALASAGGLFIPGLYRDNNWVVPQVQGQDLVTLALVLPLLALVLPAVRRGSARATVVWIGLLGYIFYTYTGAAFAYAFNPMFLVYVALFSLSLFALAAAGTGIDAEAIRGRFDARTPRGPVVAFMVFIVLVLCALWLGQIIPALLAGTVPESVAMAESPTMFVYVLDLGFVVPLAALAAVWLRRQAAWGYILAGFILIKAATMGLALLSMALFAGRVGIPTSTDLVASYLLIALGGLGFSVWYFRHCRG